MIWEVAVAISDTRTSNGSSWTASGDVGVVGEEAASSAEFVATLGETPAAGRRTWRWPRGRRLRVNGDSWARADDGGCIGERDSVVYVAVAFRPAFRPSCRDPGALGRSVVGATGMVEVAVAVSLFDESGEPASRDAGADRRG